MNCRSSWKGLPHHITRELRHSFGTVAGKHFTPDAIRAAMGHAGRDTSENYVHPDEATTAEVQAKVLSGFLPGIEGFFPKIAPNQPEPKQEITCPHCGEKLDFPLKKGPKP